MSASDAPPSAPEPEPGFAHSRTYDLAFGAPVALFYAFLVAGTVIRILRQWPDASSAVAWLTIANESAILLVFGLQAILFLVRRLPVTKTREIWPRAVAILGANFNFTLLLLPHAALGTMWTAVSFGLTIGGAVASVVVLTWLGRAFSVFPEARRFVDRGPYRFVRHPLFLAEMVSMLGVMLGFRQPWAAMIMAVTIAFQIRRMDFEEAVLAETFPAYDAYRRKTARLIPGLY